MSVATTAVAFHFGPVAAGVPCNCPAKLYIEQGVKVTYGAAKLPATLGLHYTVVLQPLANYDSFQIVPTAALIAAIATAVETNEIDVTRATPFTSDFSDTDGNFTLKIMYEFDRTLMRSQEMYDQITLVADIAEDLEGVLEDAEEFADMAEAANIDFQKRYLGAKTANPTVDNFGQPLQSGVLYFNTVAVEMRVFTPPSTWTAVYTPVSGYATITYVNSSIAALTKASVGLANVDNTSDANKPVSSAQATAIAAKASKNGYDTIVTTSDAPYTLVLADGLNALVRTNYSIARDFTIPTNASVAFPVNTKIDVLWYGVGQPTIVGAVGVTVVAAGNRLKVGERYAAVSLVKMATNEWAVVGSTVA